MEKEIDFLEEMGNFVFTSRYAKYNKRAKRRETWEESVNRVEKMHLKKYDFLDEKDKDEIKWAFDLVRDKRVVPSMRSMQFGGKAIEAKHERMFNCAVRHIDSLRSFSEIFFLLLCGNGTGIGLSEHYLSRLPDLVDKKNKTGSVITYVIEDTIEGWADSVQALLHCYFKNTAYTGRKITFDYSKIRPAGAILKTGGGKAPGYKGLKNALTKIKKHLDHIIEYKNQNRLKSVDAYDILMHCADAVLSGGVRRSATSIIFDINDKEMMSAKTDFTVDKVFSFDHVEDLELNKQITKIYEGKVSFEGQKIEVKINEFELDNLKKNKKISWRHLFPQRARSNNSALLVRDKTTINDLKSIVEMSKQYGEPGFVYGVDNQLFNPCFTIDTRVLTEDGWRSFEQLLNKEVNILQDGRVIGTLSNNEEFWDIDLSKNPTTVLNKASNTRKTGEGQQILNIEFSCSRSVRTTENHHFATKRGMVMAKNLLDSDEVLVPIGDKYTANRETIDYKLGYIAGMVFGDGCYVTDKESKLCCNINIWDNNKESGPIQKTQAYVDELLNHYEQILPKNTNTLDNPIFKPCTKVGNVDKYSLSSMSLFHIFKANGIESKDNCDWLHLKNKDFKCGFISGLFFADGHSEISSNKKTCSLRLSSVKIELLKNIQLILQEMGILSRIYPMHEAGKRLLPDSNRKMVEYDCKKTYRLCIGGLKMCLDTLDVIDAPDKDINKILLHKNNSKKIYSPKFYTKVKSVSEDGVEDVYCLSEDNRRTLIANGVTARRCFEIGFLPVKDGVCGVQFCNLTSINGKLCDTKEKFKDCMKASVIIGTLQAGYTNFEYLTNTAKELTEDEALLGCSITGMMENPDILLNGQIQREMAEYSKKINKTWAKKININPAARINCIKPEGSTSAVLGTCSGIHPHHSKKYIRRIQMNKLDNTYQFFNLFNSNVCEESVWSANKTDDVIMFPIEVCDKAIVKKDLSAIDHLKIIKSTQENWVIQSTTEYNKKPISHNVSCTVIVKENEWDDVINYIFKNRDYFSAVSFIPDFGDKIYAQAPMETIDENNENDLKLWNYVKNNFQHVDYKKFKEDDDQTSLSQEFTCAGGSCEIK